ncbi:predicted protein [Uncinocarpus reesii 1704]|uniref:CBM21 domain-containing protein n=1 Tax=Uncinocarpus reesii (strain UAMH 1704) TaxID=336963 RepID=C4JXG0_UNCRE|nr:uncharacterized protein UREG_06333 [Uncinocarpus reesii 1704]EEP81468.1 predicted protein [Uncinocarpus reesii 1704]
MSMEPQPMLSSAEGATGRKELLSPRAELPLVVTDARRKPPSIDILPLRSSSVDGTILRQLPEIEMHTPDQSDREDEESVVRPSMIRKKSGELVRPALRMKKRPSSMPGTPTFVKNVHFDVQLEQVRHFLQLDMPVAVSAGSSPADEYDGDTEFPFGADSVPQTKPFQWEARVTNFPKEVNERSPVRLERMFLSSDNKYLVGIVAVANLAFHKHVVARFTLDHWKTVSEVEAEYDNNPRKDNLLGANSNYDRFHFHIRLADLADLESKTMFVCIRYHVNGLEFWDNNDARNYHVNFSRKYKWTNGSRGHACGPSNPFARNIRINPRPHSMPPLPSNMPFLPARSFQSPRDDGFSRPQQQVPLSHADDDLLDTPTKRTKPPAQAFATRYDFGSSLSAAMQPGTLDLVQPGSDTNNRVTPLQDMGGMLRTKLVSSPSTFSREPIRPSDILSEKPYHESPGYKELVDKYCFFETASSPTKARSRPDDPQSTVDENQPNPHQELPPSESPLFSSVEASPTHEEPSMSLPFRSPRPQSPNDPSSSSSSPLRFHSLRQTIPTGLLSQSPTPTPTPTAIRG